MDGKYGLVGYPLGHSFSKDYFQNKFEELNLKDYSYELFEIQSLDKLKHFIETNFFSGLNVTIPYKQSVIPYLTNLDVSAERVGAVNAIKNKNGVLTGYNTDYPAFSRTLKTWLQDNVPKALVLGTGGASKAVEAALKDLEISYQRVSRTKSDSTLSYQQLMENEGFFSEHKLIINTTPLGMAPHVNTIPDLPYQFLNSSHYLYDLVYNPEETLFIKKGKEAGSKTKNGLEMLHLQADLAWEIWNA